MTSKPDSKKNGRSVIRPYMPCADCGVIVNLEWKNKSEIHWEHGGPPTSCIGNNNTCMFARRYLYHLLVDNFCININGKCTNCYQEWRKTLPCLVAKRTLPLKEEKSTSSLNVTLPPLTREESISSNKLEYKEEYPYLNGDTTIILDIAALRPDGSIAFAIKLCSETDIPSQVDNFPYYGIIARDILDNYDRIQPIVGVTYLDKRCKQLCNPHCISTKEIALTLGYLIYNKSYSCEAVRIVEKALSGFYFSDVEVWNLSGYRNIVETNYIKEMWDNFLLKGCCIRCNLKDPDIAYKRPYCNNCYSKLHAGETFPVTRITVTEAEKKMLRKSLSWLDKVPRKSSKRDTCFFCNKNYFSRKENEGLEKFWDPLLGYVSSSINWFKAKKSCCTVCLDDQMRKRGILK